MTACPYQSAMSHLLEFMEDQTRLFEFQALAKRPELIVAELEDPSVSKTFRGTLDMLRVVLGLCITLVIDCLHAEGEYCSRSVWKSARTRIGGAGGAILVISGTLALESPGRCGRSLLRENRSVRGWSWSTRGKFAPNCAKNLSFVMASILPRSSIDRFFPLHEGTSCVRMVG